MNNSPGSSDYRVAWVCATKVEYNAALLMLDEVYDRLYTSSQDDNVYTYGRIGEHYVIIPAPAHNEYGKVRIANITNHMDRTFTALRTRLLVGLAGGAPHEDQDIRLGDLVISTPSGQWGGVVQYDKGKCVQGCAFELTGPVDKAPIKLRSEVLHFESQHDRIGVGQYIVQKVTSMLMSGHLPPKYKRPDAATDILFHSSFRHPIKSVGNFKECQKHCFPQHDKIIIRPADREMLVVHHGNIASGDMVIKDAKKRDREARRNKILCFDMEAAGLDMSRYLVIRAICDYSDSHKNDLWQNHAAALAATYARELILGIPAKSLDDIPPLTNESDDVLPERLASMDRGESSKKRKRSLNESSNEYLLQSFAFDKIDVRENHLGHAAQGTFQWLVEGPTEAQIELPFGYYYEIHNSPDPCGFIRWFEAGRGIFRIIGKLGCGKSTLMKLLSSENCCRQPLQKWAAPTMVLIVRFFAWSAGEELQRTRVGFLRTAFHQIFKQDHSLIDKIFEKTERDLCYRKLQIRRVAETETWSLTELLLIWNRFLDSKVYRLCVFMDGLDEFDENMHEMMSFINEAIKRSDGRLKLLIAGRDDNAFDDMVKPSEKLWLHDWTQPDVGQFILKLIKNHPAFEQFDTDESQNLHALVTKIADKAEGIFVWAKLATFALIECLFDGDNTNDLFKQLEVLPKEMSDLYSTILSRMSASQLVQAKSYFDLLDAVNLHWAQDALLVFTLAFDYDFQNAMWIVETARMNKQSVKSKAQVLTRKVLKCCSHFLSCVYQDDSKYAMFDYIHRSAYDFLRSDQAQAILSKASPVKKDWESAVFAAEIAKEVIVIRDRPQKWQDNRPVLIRSLMGTVANRLMHATSDLETPVPCVLEENIRAQLWTTMSSWLCQRHPIGGLPLEQELTSAHWKLSLLSNKFLSRTKKDQDFACLSLLSLTGFNILEETALIQKLSLPQKIDLLTFDLVGRMPNDTPRPELCDLLDSIIEDNEELHAIVGALWYRL